MHWSPGANVHSTIHSTIICFSTQHHLLFLTQYAASLEPFYIITPIPPVISATITVRVCRVLSSFFTDHIVRITLCIIRTIHNNLEQSITIHNNLEQSITIHNNLEESITI